MQEKGCVLFRDGLIICVPGCMHCKANPEPRGPSLQSGMRSLEMQLQVVDEYLPLMMSA